MNNPSERAIAQAFREWSSDGSQEWRDNHPAEKWVPDRAREIDAAAETPHLDAVHARLARSGVFKVTGAAAPDGAQPTFLEFCDAVLEKRAREMDAVDAARLDWLISKPLVMVGELAGRGWYVEGYGSGQIITQGHNSAREAIDAARASGGGGA